MDKKDFIKHDANNIKKIYIDLDGVLADFDKWKLEYAKTYQEILINNSEFWRQASKVNHLYKHLDVMPDAFKLLKYLKSLNIPLAILTGIPKKSSMPEAEQDKRDWVKKYIGDIEFNIGPYSVNKQRFSGPGLVLIDDNELNITQWIQKGGIGILYTDFNSCKKELEKYL